MLGVISRSLSTSDRDNDRVCPVRGTKAPPTNRMHFRSGNVTTSINGNITVALPVALTDPAASRDNERRGEDNRCGLSHGHFFSRDCTSFA